MKHNKLQEKQEELKGIGGWLLFFIITNTIYLLISMLSTIYELSLDSELWVVLLVSIVMYGILYTPFALLIFRKNKSSVYVMQGYLILNFIIGIFTLSVGLLSSTIWFIYFLKSRRVRNTYLKG